TACLDVRQDSCRSQWEIDGPRRGHSDRPEFLDATLLAAEYRELGVHHLQSNRSARALADLDALVHGHLGVGEASLEDGSHGGVEGRGPLVIGRVELAGRGLERLGMRVGAPYLTE